MRKSCMRKLDLLKSPLTFIIFRFDCINFGVIQKGEVYRMVYNWENSFPKVKTFVYHLLDRTKNILDNNLVGFYIHGSLAMGGFNPKSSDIDILVVTTIPIAK